MRVFWQSGDKTLYEWESFIRKVVAEAVEKREKEIVDAINEIPWMMDTDIRDGAAMVEVEDVLVVIASRSTPPTEA